MARKYVLGEDFIRFFSNAKAPYAALSNFAWIEDGITIDGLTFPSSEHAYQSYKYVPEDRVRFSVDGDLGQPSGFHLVFSEKDVESKRAYWMKKGNIGIIAKMATSKIIGTRLKLRRDPDFETSAELWMTILHAKFEHDEFRTVLLETGNLYLLEFSRSAKREEESGKGSYWAGLIENDTLYGKNTMGRYLMRVRKEIREAETSLLPESTSKK